MASFLSRLARLVRRGEATGGRSILLPFFIISAGLGALAWRSYQLSVRMESGANTLALQYVRYAADITARRVDAAIRAEMYQAFEQGQKIERQAGVPMFSSLQQWIDRNPWIVSAIYVPDSDPTRSVYETELPAPGAPQGDRLTREFYTSSGSVRYTYDSARLLERVKGAIRQQPFIRADEVPAPAQTRKESEIRLVSNPPIEGLVRTGEGVAFVAPLATPLDRYAIRATVPTLYMGSGWENHRVVSVWISAAALLLTALGSYLAMRGLRRESEAMQLRGALIANVSHELRTPLSMIRLGAETLKRRTKLTVKQREEIEDSILREVLHLSHLVENVLDVARIQQSKSKAVAVSPVYPRELVTSLMTTYDSWIRNKGFTVSLAIDEQVEEQQWDRDAVSRALLNLIDNAIKYSADEKWIGVSLRKSEQWIELAVSDHGIGIDPKEIDRIFEPYYRARFSDTQTRRGAGLGLTLIQQIASSHGGRVEVESELGRGSTFRLLFPRSLSATAAAPVNLPATSGAHS